MAAVPSGVPAVEVWPALTWKLAKQASGGVRWTYLVSGSERLVLLRTTED